MGAGYSMKARNDEAEVYIYEDIGESWFGGVSAKQFAADLKALGAVTTINVHINSYGGEVFDGVAIYRQLASHPARVISHIDGVAASIASVIAMAGDEIHIAESAMIMIHNASGGAFGQAGELRKLADLLDTITATIADVYVARTGQDRAAVLSFMGEETWFTADMAVELLFADKVVENLRVAARVDHKAVRAQTKRPDPRSALDVLTAAAVAEGLVVPTDNDPPTEAPAPAAPRLAAVRANFELQRAQLAARHTRPAA